jgi:serine/threonine protein kinase HipA of HipAB toxin-antitoxin module
MSSNIPAEHPRKRRRGRPRKLSEDRRDKVFTVSLNDEELVQFHANRGEREPADFLRLIATRRAPVPPLVPSINREEYIRLYQLERGLESLAAAVRPDELTRPTEVAGHLWRLLTQTRSEVVALRRALLGMEP